MPICKQQGRYWVGGLAKIHTLAKDMSLNRGATHFTLGLRPCFILSFLLKIYLRPPLKFTQLRPLYLPTLLDILFFFFKTMFCVPAKVAPVECLKVAGDDRYVLFAANHLRQ